MRLAGSVRALAVISVLGLVGCGSGAKQDSSTDGMAATTAVKAEIRKSFQKKMQDATAKRRPMGRGNARAKPEG
jgi:uncharacterized protein YceK